jgi:hypothetical protein
MHNLSEKVFRIEDSQIWLKVQGNPKDVLDEWLTGM